MFTTTLKTIPEMPEKTEPTDQSPPRTGCDLGRCSHSWASDLERGDDSSSDRPGTGTDSGALLSSVEDYKRAEDDDDGKDHDAAGLTGRDFVAIAGAFCCLLSTMGVINAVGLLQRHMEQNQLRDYSPPQVGWIAAANSFLTLFSPLLAGPMYDRWGHSRIVAAGAGLFTAGIVVTSVLDGRTATADPAATYWLLFVFWGVFCGSGTGFVSTAVTGYTSGRFDKRRGLALGLGSAGGSMGGIVWPLVLRATLRAWGWMPAMLLVGGLAFFLLALGALCLCPAAVMFVVGSQRRQQRERGRELEEGKRKEKKEEKEEEGKGEDRRGRRGISWASVWKVLSRVLSQGDFVLLTMSLVAFQFVVTGIMGTMPGWADRESFDRENIFYVVAAVNGGAVVGRSVVGFLSDKMGRFNAVILAQLLGVLWLFLFLTIGGTEWKFFLVASCWGFTSGAVLGMMIALIREVCAEGEFGTYLGINSFAVSIAGAVSIPAGTNILAVLGPDMLMMIFAFCVLTSMILLCLSRAAKMKWEWAIFRKRRKNGKKETKIDRRSCKKFHFFSGYPPYGNQQQHTG